MGGVNFGGLSSGLDTNLIIESLLANKQRRVDNINDLISEGESKKKAFDEIKSAVSTFEGIIEGLGEKVFGNRSVTSGDESIVVAEADETSDLGDHEIVVNNLAARSVVTVGQTQSSASAVIGAGTLNLNFGNNPSLAVTLTDGASTLSDLSNAINDQHGDTVQASIVEVSAGSFQLVLSAKETGADLNIADETDGAGSSSITGFAGTFLDATDVNSGGINRTQDGENSEIVLDGITITRSTNKIDDVLTGVTLNLKGETGAGSPTSLKVDTDLDEVADQIDEFVKGYNDVLSRIDKYGNPETGVLKTDSDLRSLKTSLQQQITRFVAGSDTFNVRDNGDIGFTSLSQLGIKSDQKSGSLTLDRDDLKEALEENFEEVQGLFLGQTQTSNQDITFTANTGVAFSGQVVIDSVAETATIDGTTYALERAGDALRFGSGSEYEGLTFFDNSGGTGTATIDISSGIGALLQDQTDKYGSFSGILADRVDGITDRKRTLEKQLETAEQRIEDERTRLTRIFARSEQAISSLQGLQASLGAQSQIKF